MYVVELENGMSRLIKLFFAIGFWHRGDNPTLTQIVINTFYCVYYLFFPISLIAGAITNENSAESVSLLAIALSNVTLVVKIYHIIWRKKDILQMMNRNCIYTVDDQETFILIDNKLKSLMKFFTVFAFSAAMAAFCSIIAHIGYLGRERQLFFKIGFPFDYKTNEIAFWLALAFNSTEEIVAVLIIFFSTIVWYLMVHCAFKYEILGHKLRTLGLLKRDSTAVFQYKRRAEKEEQFLRNLIFGIHFYREVRE